MKNISYSKQAIKAVNAMDRPTKLRIKNAVEKLPDGDVKPLKGTKDSLRLRVGNWRILFSYMSQDEVIIEKIAPRGEIYKGVQ